MAAGHPPEDVKAAVLAVSYSPYFTRMWIVQEIACAAQAILAGEYTAPLRSLGYWSEELRRPSQSSGRRAFSHQANMLLQNADPNIVEGVGHANISHPAFGFAIALADSKAKRCSDPRDKVFAILGLPIVRAFDPVVRLEADYSMTLPEVAVASLAYIDLLRGGESSGDWGLAAIWRTLRIGMELEDFRSWLCLRLHWDGMRSDDIMEVSSGRRIDCSGSLIQSILRGDLDENEPESPVSDLADTVYGESEPDEEALGGDLLRWIYSEDLER